jgi:hypothetical protein
VNFVIKCRPIIIIALCSSEMKQKYERARAREREIEREDSQNYINEVGEERESEGELKVDKNKCVTIDNTN